MDERTRFVVRLSQSGCVRSLDCNATPATVHPPLLLSSINSGTKRPHTACSIQMYTWNKETGKQAGREKERAEKQRRRETREEGSAPSRFATRHLPPSSSGTGAPPSVEGAPMSRERCPSRCPPPPPRRAPVGDQILGEPGTRRRLRVTRLRLLLARYCRAPRRATRLLLPLGLVVASGGCRRWRRPTLSMTVGHTKPTRRTDKTDRTDRQDRPIDRPTDRPTGRAGGRTERAVPRREGDVLGRGRKIGTSRV